MFSNLKDKVVGLFGGGGGGGGGKGKKLKVTVISESLDIGLPLRATYNLWTQYEDFPSFMKKVETVEQESDEKTNWTAKVFWSRRTWQATIIEQVPDSHIIWRSTGPKGHVDGAVGFTEIGPNFTRVLLVLTNSVLTMTVLAYAALVRDGSTTIYLDPYAELGDLVFGTGLLAAAVIAVLANAWRDQRVR